MEKFTWKCVKALFLKYFFLVYTTLHRQSTDRIRIRWKFSGSDQKGPDPQPWVRVRYRIIKNLSKNQKWCREKKESTRLGTPQKGYVAALKDGFGFIETLQHDKEIFFHFSNIEGKGDKLEVRSS